MPIENVSHDYTGGSDRLKDSSSLITSSGRGVVCLIKFIIFLCYFFFLLLHVHNAGGFFLHPSTIGVNVLCLINGDVYVR